MTRASALTLATLTLLVPNMQAVAADTSAWLPLSPGRKWVLRNPAQSKPVQIEVLSQESDSFHVKFTSPWNSVDWMLTPGDGKISLTGYGTNGQTAPLPRDTVFFDFVLASDRSWSNKAGKFTVVSRNASVKDTQRSYEGCIAIRHQAGGSKFLYTFAPGVGFVQFGEGSNALCAGFSSSGNTTSQNGRGKSLIFKRT